jgi:predicted tellurium resistance membrane protein TerC
MEPMSFGMSLVEITWLNVLLSGDNALVIALACRQLEGRRRQLGIVFGAGAAVLLRIVFTAGVTFILRFPFLRAGGALLPSGLRSGSFSARKTAMTRSPATARFGKRCGRWSSPTSS